MSLRGTIKKAIFSDHATADLYEVLVDAIPGAGRPLAPLVGTTRREHGRTSSLAPQPLDNCN